MISSFLATALLGAAPSPALAVPCPTTTLPVPLDRWRLEVFNNRSLTGSPVEARYDAGGSGGFAFDWGSGRGSECTGVDNFGICFQRRNQSLDKEASTRLPPRRTMECGSGWTRGS